MPVPDDPMPPLHAPLALPDEGSWMRRSQLAVALRTVCLTLVLGSGAAVGFSAQPLRTAATVVLAWLLGLPLLVGVQFGLSAVISHRAGQPVGGGLAWWRAWWQECCDSARVFGWWQPWVWRRVPDHWLAAPGTIGVVLVHGYFCNRGMWQTWQRTLQAQGVPVVAVNLSPVLGGIDGYVPIVDEAVRRMHAQTGRTPLVVAHSMGGLAVRAWARATPDALACVAHVVTIATPHQGTWIAQLGLGQNARQMVPGNAWLTELARTQPAGLAALTTCWHSCADNIVFPFGTAALPGSTVRHVPHVGHMALAEHPAVLADTLAWLAAANGGATVRADKSHELGDGS